MHHDSFIIEGGAKIEGTVKVSGNKNEALPALMSCLLTNEPVTLANIPPILDVLTICDILKDLGVKVNWVEKETVILHAEGDINFKPNPALCTKVRASILLLGSLLNRCKKIELALPGGDVIGARRVDTHFEGISSLGAKLEFSSVITGTVEKSRGCDLYLDEPSVTATENILLFAVLAEGKTILYNTACEPHVNGLAKLLNSMGAKISGIGSNRLEVEGVKKLHGTTHTIGADFMEVGSFLCLGAIGGGKVTIEGCQPEDLRFILKTMARLGIHPEIGKTSLTIDGTKKLKVSNDISGRLGTIYSGPWPAFPTDLMSVAIVAATQSHGTIVFFEKMFEGRMFFTDKLIAMGANIVLCDPHRIVTTGPSQLYSAHVSSPDVRAGMAMLMTAAISEGTSQIDNIYQIERGYFEIEKKFKGLGVNIKRES